MRDGLFSVHFKTPLGQGAGVVTLAGGKMTGGDSAIYYVGDYTQDGDTFTATVKTGRHTNDRSFVNVFGKDSVTIRITGTSTDDKATLSGSSPDAPGVSFSATLTRLAD